MFVSTMIRSAAWRRKALTARRPFRRREFAGQILEHVGMIAIVDAGYDDARLVTVLADAHRGVDRDDDPRAGGRKIRGKAG
jgi:hypothetical protein